MRNVDESVKSLISGFSVIPARVAIRYFQNVPLPGLGRSHDFLTFYRFINVEC